MSNSESLVVWKSVNILEGLNYSVKKAIKMANENLLQYKLFSSFVHPSFWHKLAELKIEVDRLNENRKSISGFYSNNNSSHCLLEVDCTSFNK